MDPTRPTRVAEAILQQYNSLQVKDEGWTVVAGIAAVDAGGLVTRIDPGTQHLFSRSFGQLRRVNSCAVMMDRCE